VSGLLVAAVGVPLLCALPAMLERCPDRLLRALAAGAPLPALLLAVASSADEALSLPYLFFGALWSLDELRRVFLLLTAGLWAVAGMYAAGYMAAARLRRFHGFWCLTLTGNLGLILSVDIASFYSFFALMTFAAYGLVVHDGGVRAQDAGRIYLIMAVLGELLLLAGLLLGTRAAGSVLLSDLPGAVAGSDSAVLIAGLLWLGFGVKAGLPLLHFWLPLAHPVAPTPASAVLSGAMIKAGLLGWLLVLPLEGALPVHWGFVIAGAGAVGSLGAAAIGVCQRETKTVLAYSSISQMGLMTLLLGAAVAEPAAAEALVPVVALYAVHHGLAKGALFLATGLKLPAAAGPRALVWVLIVLPGLSLAGLPFTSGAAAKLLAKSVLEPPAAAYWGSILALGAVATTVLVLRFLLCMASSTGRGVNPARVTFGWLACTAASIACAAWIARTAAGWWPAGAHTIALVPSWPDAWTLAWPLVAGGALAGLAMAARIRAPSVPAGDGVIGLAALGARAQAGLVVWAGKAAALVSAPIGTQHRIEWLQRVAQAIESGEAGARRQAGVLFLAVLMLIAGLAMW
jgi:hydrogenase-4 component B